MACHSTAKIEICVVLAALATCVFEWHSPGLWRLHQQQVTVECVPRLAVAQDEMTKAYRKKRSKEEAVERGRNITL